MKKTLKVLIGGGAAIELLYLLYRFLPLNSGQRILLYMGIGLAVFASTLLLARSVRGEPLEEAFRPGVGPGGIGFSAHPARGAPGPFRRYLSLRLGRKTPVFGDQPLCLRPGRPAPAALPKRSPSGPDQLSSYQNHLSAAGPGLFYPVLRPLPGKRGRDEVPVRPVQHGEHLFVLPPGAPQPQRFGVAAAFCLESAVDHGDRSQRAHRCPVPVFLAPGAAFLLSAALAVRRDRPGPFRAQQADPLDRLACLRRGNFQKRDRGRNLSSFFSSPSPPPWRWRFFLICRASGTC